MSILKHIPADMFKNLSFFDKLCERDRIQYLQLPGYAPRVLFRHALVCGGAGVRQFSRAANHTVPARHPAKVSLCDTIELTSIA